jgi:integrase
MTVAGYVGRYFVKSENKEKWFYVLTLGKDSNGKRVQKRKRGFKGKKEAEKALREAQVTADKGKYVEPTKILFSNYVIEWLKGKSYSISSQTVKSHQSYIKTHIVPRLGNIPLSELKSITIKRFINELKDKGLADATVKRIYNIVTASLNEAVKLKIIPFNEASLVDPPKVKRKQLHVWNVEEVKRFLKFVEESNTRYYIAFHIALATGMRQGEILGLRWIDVDLDRHVISIRQTLSHDGKEFIPGAKSASGIRSIAIDSDTVKALLKHRDFIQEEKKSNGKMYICNDLVVCTNIGKQTTPRDLVKAWTRLRDKAGMRKITFHDLRHYVES